MSWHILYQLSYKNKWAAARLVIKKTTMWCFRTGLTQIRLYRSRLEAWNFGFRKKTNCTIRVAKTKTLISFAVTAKLICVFFFTYADCWFSHEVAQMSKYRLKSQINNHLLIRNISIITLIIWAMTQENWSSGFLTRSDTNRPVQSQKKVRILKFWVDVEEELYYQSSENKDADQLCSYYTADLRLCFRIGKNPVF